MLLVQCLRLYQQCEFELKLDILAASQRVLEEEESRLNEDSANGWMGVLLTPSRLLPSLGSTLLTSRLVLSLPKCLCLRINRLAAFQGVMGLQLEERPMRAIRGTEEILDILEGRI